MSCIKIMLRGVDKRVYLQLMRENYTHILPELQELVKNSHECKTITIDGDAIVLERYDGVKLFFDFKQAISRAEGNLLVDGDGESEDIDWTIKKLNEQKGTVLDIGANMVSIASSYFIRTLT